VVGDSVPLGHGTFVVRSLTVDGRIASVGFGVDVDPA
jgi:hypothetical protein